MRSTGTPGVIANMDRKNGAIRDGRRMNGLRTAAEILGGQEPLASALGMDTRLLRKKMAAERPIHDEEIVRAASALTARARAADDLATRLTAIIEQQVAK